VTINGFQLQFAVDHRPGCGAFSYANGIRKKRWFVVVAFLGAAGMGIFIGFLVGYALG
jgi:hypothetical protein